MAASRRKMSLAAKKQWAEKKKEVKKQIPVGSSALPTKLVANDVSEFLALVTTRLPGDGLRRRKAGGPGFVGIETRIGI